MKVNEFLQMENEWKLINRYLIPGWLAIRLKPDLDQDRWPTFRRTVGHPVFIVDQLFDYLGIGSVERMTARSRIEYLRLIRDQIKCITMGCISRTGVFMDALQYVQFNLSLCICLISLILEGLLRYTPRISVFLS